MEDQELFMQATQIGQELDRIVKHKQAVEAELLSSNAFLEQIDNFPKASGSKILTQLSHGVYAHSLLEPKDFLVQVGAGILVTRTQDDVLELLKKNVSQLRSFTSQLSAQEEFYTQQLQQLLAIAEQKQNNANSSE